MKQIAIKVKVPEEVTLYAERHFYIVEGLKALMLSFSSNTEFPVDKEKFDQTKTEYLEAYAALSIALRKLFRKYLDPHYLDASMYEQEVDFEFNEIIVYHKGACSIHQKK
jgi:hypothetical protein